MHRLLVEGKLLEDGRPVLVKDAARHLKVLRVEAEEAVELFDGRGRFRRYRWNAAERRLEAIEAVVRTAPPRLPLTLFACVTKGSRWDWTVEKAVELGVTRIVPIISDRTIVRISAAEREVKRERFRRIAEDAARQSDSYWVPEVVAPVDFKAALPLIAQTRAFIGALTTPPSPLLSACVSAALATGGAAAELAAVIGPEGDFTPAELAALMAVATPTSFGNAILRAETAALYALSVIQGLRG